MKCKIIDLPAILILLLVVCPEIPSGQQQLTGTQLAINGAGSVLEGYVCLKNTGCFECRGELCNGGDFFNSGDDCIEACHVPRPRDGQSGVICSSDFQCLPCSNAVCDLGTYYKSMGGCENDCIQYPSEEIMYYCNVGTCVSCESGQDCPNRKTLFTDKPDCLANCDVPRRQQPKKAVMLQYCSPEKDCTSCTKGKDCPKGTTYKTNELCLKKCKKPPVMEERFYCQFPDSCTNCTSNKDCPDMAGLYKEEEVCLVTCKARQPSEYRFFCDKVLQQCRECTTDCPTDTTLYYNTEQCLWNCQISTNTGLYTCSSDGKCYPCTLSSGCGLANSQVCAFLPPCTPYAVFNDKTNCQQECTKQVWYCKGGKSCSKCAIHKCSEKDTLMATKEQCETSCNQNDKDGKPEVKKCKDNTTEVFDLCPQPEQTCDTSSTQSKSDPTKVKKCRAKCVCRAGYVRHEKKCIQFRDCPECPPLAVYRIKPYTNGFFGSNACPPTCDVPDAYLTPAGCTKGLPAGCQCPPGFFINTTKNENGTEEMECMPLSMCPHPINWYCGAQDEIRVCIPCKPSSCPRKVLNYHTKESCDNAVIDNPYDGNICLRVAWTKSKNYIQTVSLNPYLPGDNDELLKEYPPNDFVPFYDG